MRSHLLLLFGATTALAAQAPDSTVPRGELRIAAGRTTGMRGATGEIAILSTTPGLAVGIEAGAASDDFPPLSFRDAWSSLWADDRHEAAMWAGALLEARTAGRIRLGVSGGVGVYRLMTHDGFGVGVTAKTDPYVAVVAYPTAPKNLESRSGAGVSGGVLLEANATDRIALRAQLRHHALVTPRWEWAFAAAQAGVQFRLGKRPK